MRIIFDGHLDLSWNALSWGRDITLDLDELNRSERGMTDHPARGRATTTLPEMRRGAIAVCQATLLCRARPEGRPHDGPSRLNLDFANQEIASATARGQLAYYELLERRGLLRMIRTATDLDAHMQSWSANPDSTPIGYILAMEGADPIVDVDHAAAWWELGLRSVNLAHYGKSWYAVGTGGDGPLTPDGVRLLKEFERLGMILDATHLSDTSFFQALDTFRGPVLASHNNCRELVPDGRQFSDEQIHRLIERDAVIGRPSTPGCSRRLDPGPDHARRGRARCRGRPHRPRLPTGRQRPARRHRQRPRRRLRDRADPRRPRSHFRPPEARCHPRRTRILLRGDRRHLPRQLAAVLPGAPAALSLEAVGFVR